MMYDDVLEARGGGILVIPVLLVFGKAFDTIEHDFLLSIKFSSK